MGWLIMNKPYYENDIKENVLNYCFKNRKDNIEHIEIKNRVAYMIYNENGKKYGLIYLLRQTKKEFGYKDMDITMCPYCYDCSKKFYNMVKEIYVGERLTEWVQEWLDNYIKYQDKKKQEKNKRNKLKVGTLIEFVTANYGGKKQWRVSNIIGKKVLFEGYNLRGWKQQEFNIIEEGV